jgi:hypothetical protein
LQAKKPFKMRILESNWDAQRAKVFAISALFDGGGVGKSGGGAREWLRDVDFYASARESARVASL